MNPAPADDTAATAISTLLSRPDLAPDTHRLITLAHQAQTQGTPLHELVAQLEEPSPTPAPDQTGRAWSTLLALIFIFIGLIFVPYPGLAFLFLGLLFLPCPWP